MNVDLLPIINNDNEKVSFNGTLVFKQEDAEINADVDGFVQNFAGRLEVRGNISATVVAGCARCLEPVTETLLLTIDETVGDDGVALDGTILEIDSIVYSEVAINLPIRFICSEDCKGLCPDCGANLNITQCQCNDTDV